MSTSPTRRPPTPSRTTGAWSDSTSATKPKPSTPTTRPPCAPRQPTSTAGSAPCTPRERRTRALDNATLERIFTDYVAPTLFACMTASAQPVGAIVGARPGAGKTHAVAVVGHEIAPDYFLLPRA